VFGKNTLENIIESGAAIFQGSISDE